MQDGLSGMKDVPGKTNTRREVVLVAGLLSGQWLRSVRNLRSGHLFEVVAHAKVQGEGGRYLPVILSEASVLMRVIDELRATKGLLEVGIAGQLAGATIFAGVAARRSAYSARVVGEPVSQTSIG